MAYVSPYRSPERLLIAGHAGAGKSDCVLQLAKAHPGRRLFVVEIDWAPSTDMLLSAERFAGLDNVTTLTAAPDDFNEQLEKVQTAVKLAKRGDWIAIDSIDHSWDAARDAYITRVFGEEEPEEYFLKAREAGSGKGNDLGGWEDWPYIKKLHSKIYKAVLRAQAHVVYTAGLKPIEDQGADREDRDAWGKRGVRPAGRKGLTSNVTTALMVDVDRRSGDRKMSIIKQRGHNSGAGDTFTCNNFVRDFLIARNGWVRDTEGAGGETDAEAGTSVEAGDDA